LEGKDMRAIAHTNATKEGMRKIGEELGLTGEALNNFMYALYEVEFELEVDEVTGEYEIISVDGKELKRN
jgi:hypothetical protein